MAVAEDPEALGGSCIFATASEQQWDGRGTPPASTGEAILEIDLQRGGTYVVWTRMWYAGPDGNSYWLIIDDRPAMKVGNDDQGYRAWKWVNWHDGARSNRVTVELAGGHHTIRLVGREAGTRIDTVLLTDDLGYQPQ